MTAEELATIRVLVEAHPGPYTVFRYVHDGEVWGLGDEHHDILFDGQDTARGESETAWLDALCALANAAPSLLDHIERLEARP
jgi:hypothetical protein